MNIVYTFRRNGIAASTELLYSIRSMVKHFTALEKIIVVGDRPEFYEGELIIERDVPGKPAFSIWKKLKAAKQDKPFLWAADDHFLLKDFDENFPNYYHRTNKEAKVWQKGKIGPMLQKLPDEWLNYIVHCPMVFDPEKMGEMTEQAPIKTFYANTNNLPGTEMKDFKFYKPHTYEQIKSMINGKPFFSTSPYCLNRDMMKILQELYPDRSPYEKANTRPVRRDREKSI